MSGRFDGISELNVTATPRYRPQIYCCPPERSEYHTRLPNSQPTIGTIHIPQRHSPTHMSSLYHNSKATPRDSGFRLTAQSVYHHVLVPAETCFSSSHLSITSIINNAPVLPQQNRSEQPSPLQANIECIINNDINISNHARPPHLLPRLRPSLRRRQQLQLQSQTRRQTRHPPKQPQPIPSLDHPQLPYTSNPHLADPNNLPNPRLAPSVHMGHRNSR